MLYAVNIENAHEFGDVMPQLHRLRYKQFKERQSYDVPAYKNMEYDQYDTIATVYLVWLDKHGIMRGCARLNPTNRPYMLKDLWPQMANNALPESSSVWEGTRICIEKDLPCDLREQIKSELILGHAEFGLANGIERYIGVMQSFIWKRVWMKAGWDVEFVGEERLIDGIRTRAGQGYVSHDVLARLRETTGIHYDVLGNQYRVDIPACAVAS